MTRFFIEVPHDEDEASCVQVVNVFLNSGSHFLTHADWGCMDGEHKAWFILEAESKEEAMHVVPPAFRHEARIVALNKFTKEEMNEIVNQHQEQ
jgi:hypothetical protein